MFFVCFITQHVTVRDRALEHKPRRGRMHMGSHAQRSKETYNDSTLRLSAAARTARASRAPRVSGPRLLRLRLGCPPAHAARRGCTDRSLGSTPRHTAQTCAAARTVGLAAQQLTLRRCKQPLHDLRTQLAHCATRRLVGVYTTTTPFVS